MRLLPDLSFAAPRKRDQMAPGVPLPADELRPILDQFKTLREKKDLGACTELLRSIQRRYQKSPESILLDKAKEKLLAALDATDEFVRSAAMSTLGELGAPEAVDCARDALGCSIDLSPDFLKACADVLGRNLDAESRACLRRKLNASACDGVALACAKALAPVADKEEVDAVLARALRADALTPGEYIRCVDPLVETTRVALSQLVTKPALSPSIRAACAEMLRGDLELDVAKQILLERRRDPEDEFQLKKPVMAAVFAQDSKKAERVVFAQADREERWYLKALPQGKEYEVMAAVEAVAGRVDDRGIQKALIVLLQKFPSTRVKLACARALAGCPGSDALDAFARTLEDAPRGKGAGDLYTVCADALGKSGREKDIDFLIDNLPNADNGKNDISRYCAHALEENLPPEKVERVWQIMASNSGTGVGTAVNGLIALTGQQAPEVRALLQQNLKGGAVEATAAARALKGPATKKEVDALFYQLDSGGVYDVGRVAAESLAHSKLPVVLEGLVVRLDCSDSGRFIGCAMGLRTWLSMNDRGVKGTSTNTI